MADRRARVVWTLALGALAFASAPALASTREEVKLFYARSDLSEAKSRFVEAWDKREALKPQVAAGQQWADKLEAVATTATESAAAAQQRMAAKRTAARARVDRAQSAYDAEHDEQEVRETIGFSAAAALLVIGLFLIAWPKLKGAHRWLGERVGPGGLFWVAAAAVVGGLYLGGVAGTVIGTAGVAASAMSALGMASAVRETSEGDRWYLGKRGTRLYPWLSGGLALIVAVGLMVASLSQADPIQPSFPNQVRLLASAAEPDPTDSPTPAVERLLDRAAVLEADAEDAADRVAQAQDRLEDAHLAMSRNKQQLKDAASEVVRWRRLVARPDPRPLGLDLGTSSISAGSSYDDYSYDTYGTDDYGYDYGSDDYGVTGDPYDSYDAPYPDLDCSDFSAPVYGVGDDPNGLDADNDGVGCEAN